MKPADLSMAFVEAYNQRDVEAIRSLLDPEVSYVRPGPRPLDGVDAIMAQYDEDWRTYDASLEVRRVIEADDIHRWVGGRMSEYRLYLDPVSASWPPVAGVDIGGLVHGCL